MILGLLIGLFILWAVFNYLHLRTAAFIWQVLNRWICWFSFSLFATQLPFVMEWAQRPAWLVCLTAFVLWFIGETVFYVFSISLISKSDFPLFPKFKPIAGQSAWPIQKCFVETREWLREHKYRCVQSLVSDPYHMLRIDMDVYHDRLNETRLKVLIMPNRILGARMYYVFQTKLQDGQILITDNFALPFGGYYLPKWNLRRCPLVSSIDQLDKLHQKKVATFSEPVLWGDDPAEDIKQETRMLEQHNIASGFLHPSSLWEEKGRITPEGQYRLCKDMWMMNYFGRLPARNE